MKTYKGALWNFLFTTAATTALLPEEYQTSFIEADDKKDRRRVPDNAPPNADQDAYAKLANQRDIVFEGLGFQFDGGLASPAHPKAKRVKGAELMADGIDSVVITPDEMNDCDSELMADMGVESSTCEYSFDTSMEGGGVAFEVTEDDGNVNLSEEELRGEEYHFKEVMKSTEGEEYTAAFFEEKPNERRLNYDTGMTSDIGIFETLQCNLNADNSSKLPTGEECDSSHDGLMSTLVAEAGDGPVIIPCGKCIKYDLPTNSTSIINGKPLHLNIQFLIIELTRALIS